MRSPGENVGYLPSGFLNKLMASGDFVRPSKRKVRREARERWRREEERALVVINTLLLCGFYNTIFPVSILI